MERELERVSIAVPKANLLKTFIVPGALAIFALGAAVVGAFFSPNGTGGVVGGVEGLSSTSSRFLNDLGLLLPFGLAFSAGMVSSVNPCGFAMLPAYLGMYMGSGESGDPRPSIFHRLSRAVLVGSAVTAGFVLLFSLVGSVIGGGARFVVDVFPWAGLGVGVFLAVAGAWLLGGGKLYTSMASDVAARIGDPRKIGIRSYFLFGVSYGTASLACTLPIFLFVTGIGTTLTNRGLSATIGQFSLYALGMGTVIMALTLGMALFRGVMAGFLRKALPYFQPLSSVLMIAAGAYIVFYWLTIGGLLDRLT